MKEREKKKKKKKKRTEEKNRSRSVRSSGGELEATRPAQWKSDAGASNCL